MKKFWKGVVFFALAASFVFGASACAVGEHTHTAGSEWNSDGANHWHECTECGAVMDLTAHTAGGEWQSNGEEHWRVCTVCGGQADKAAHTAMGGKHTNGTEDWYECGVCDGKMDVGAHEHTYDGYMTDGEQHWQVCIGCRRETERRAHTDSGWQSDSEEHWRACTECGREEVRAAHIPSDEWQKDGEAHWHVCTVCNAKVGLSAHTPGTRVQTDGSEDWYTCTGCGYKMNVTAHEHTYEGYQTDEEQHWQVCTGCGAETEHTDHSFTVWVEDELRCVCGAVKTALPQQRVELDLRYNASSMTVEQDTVSTVSFDLSDYAGIVYTGASLDGEDPVEGSFADGVLTVHVSEFGFAYGEHMLHVYVTDTGGAARTLRVPVLLVTKVLHDKTDFDNMSAYAKACEASPSAWGGYFELGANIPYNGIYTGIMPANIDTKYSTSILDTAGNGFIGVFDGCGYAVDGIQINAKGNGMEWQNNHAVFGVVNGATIKNVAFTNATVCIKGSVVVSRGSATLENVYVSFKSVMHNNYGNISAFFHNGRLGGVVRDCYVDITQTQYQTTYSNDPLTFNFPVFGLWTKMEGVYVVGAGPDGYDPFTNPVNTQFSWDPESDASNVYGIYASEEEFAAAYNAADSVLKAEIDGWDTAYWQIEDGKVSFREKQ